MFTFDIWDKKSKINGILAKTILTDTRYKLADAILIIKEGNSIVQIQAFKPNISGNIPFTEKEAALLGEKIIKEREAMFLEELEEDIID